jgi:UDP-glucuronate 4-epimerase
VNGVVRALDRRHKYEIFNLGKGSGTSLKEFIELIEKHVGRTANVRVMPDQLGDVPYTCANVRKAELMLGYQPTVEFEEGIKRTVKWYMEAYANQSIDICPERQANGLGRAPSFVDLKESMVGL